jgi:hypothetical protein
MSGEADPARKRLRELQRVLTTFGGEDASLTAARKLACLRLLARRRLGSARDVLTLHEALCFLRAHPDDAELLATVVQMLDDFASRGDARRFADELADSGLAGTDIHYPFFAPMAGWLAKTCGERLRIDWGSVDARAQAQLLAWLESFVTPAELFGVFEEKLSVREWVERLKRDDESDAGFLVRCFDRLSASPSVRSRALEVLDLGYRLEGSADGPSRTRAHWPGEPVCFQTEPLRRARPDLTTAWKIPPRSVRDVSPRDGRKLIDLAREAMVTRGRDLDSFAYGDPHDVRMIDCGDGLQFACIGLQHEQRNVLDAVYGFLTLMNGVPIGYVLASALFRSSEIAYNVFETWRGGEAGYVYGRIIGMLHALFGSDSFTIYPYQLGHGNEEGLRSGSWWFYQKLGFRPRDAMRLRLMDKELAAIRRSRSHRSSRKTLETLAAANVYWSPKPSRDDIIGVFPGVALSLAVSDLMAERFGSDRRRGERVLADEAAQRLGVRRWTAWPGEERRAWERWAPVLALLPGLERWSAASRKDLVAVVRAKGGRRESDYVRLFDAHRPLRRAMKALGQRLAQRTPGRG